MELRTCSKDVYKRQDRLRDLHFQLGLHGLGEVGAVSDQHLSLIHI